MNYFYVYQNKTFTEEYRGGFLWSPKTDKRGGPNAGYDTMRLVKAGDLIFHSCSGTIVAISKALGKCYSCKRPSASFEEWDSNGWKIDVEYFHLQRPFDVSLYAEDLYRMQPDNGPFTSAYKGKQQYLCSANKLMFDYIIEKIRANAGYFEIQKLDEFLSKIIEESLINVDNPKIVEKITVEADVVKEGCNAKVLIVDENREVTYNINTNKFPQFISAIGKKVGESFINEKNQKVCKILKITMQIEKQ